MSARIRTIVIGIAEIHEEDVHLAAGVHLAESLDADLHVVHAFPLPVPLLYPYTEASTMSADAVTALQQQAERHLEKRVRAVSTSGRVHFRAVPSAADRAVIETAEQVGADLILVGATRRGAFSSTLLGSTAQRVLRAAAAPVLVMRRRGHGSLRRVLLTSDLSDLSEKVHVRAIDLVGGLGVEENVALRSLLVLAYDLPVPPPLEQRVLADTAKAELAGFLGRLGASPWPVKGRVRIGEPAREIVDEAARWGADLLVLGTHGRTGTSRLLIGSVAEAVLRRANCDVLVIPTSALHVHEPTREEVALPLISGG